MLKDVPCEICILFPICKTKIEVQLHKSVINMADHMGCHNIDFFNNADQEEINRCRNVFGLEGLD